MRRSSLLFIVICALAALLAGMFLHAASARVPGEAGLRASAVFVERLRLTDLCLFTEARYTRHPAVADRHAAFQDHPLSLEHFPSGSLLGAPERLRQP